MKTIMSTIKLRLIQTGHNTALHTETPWRAKSIAYLLHLCTEIDGSEKEDLSHSKSKDERNGKFSAN